MVILILFLQLLLFQSMEFEELLQNILIMSFPEELVIYIIFLMNLQVVFVIIIIPRLIFKPELDIISNQAISYSLYYSQSKKRLNPK